MKFRILLFIALCSSHFTLAQQRPKLVVGIVVDQMRMDYIYRYWDKYGDNGFKKLIREGHLCKNGHFNYIPTYTGPGHASIFTGTTPMNHGIIANNWYDKRTGTSVYCVEDPSVQSIGTQTDVGQRSPHRQLAPTLGDAIHISNQFRGKVIGISLKDRSAILPVGHSADAAYWMDYTSGDFVSSSYYMDALPGWMRDFNKQKHADKLMKNGWNTSLAIEKYVESTADDTPYEKVLNPSGRPTFPYDLTKMVADEDYYLFAVSPFGSTILRLLAEQVVINEDLGEDEHLDLLTISFSSPDMAGHAFGPQSIEVEDTYLKLDDDIAKLIAMLDNRVGAEAYTLFLTADHAAAQVPAYLSDHKMPVKLFDDDAFVAFVKEELKAERGVDNLIKNYSNQQFFLDYEVLKANRMDAKHVAEDIAEIALNFEGVSGALASKELRHPLPDNQFARLAQNGWHQQRSGDVVINYAPGWMDYGHQGTTHGSSYNYDTHVPIIFYGFGIQKGTTVTPVEITQIVPTISLVTSTAFPVLSDHRPVEAAIKK